MTRWVVGMILMLSQLGCLGFFSEPRPLESKPNNPPWINEATVEPQTQKVFIDKTANPNGSKTFFVNQAADFDAEDRLYGHWLLGRQGFESPQYYLESGPTATPPDNFDPFKPRDLIDFKITISFSLAVLRIGSDVELEFFLVDREMDREDINTGSPKWPEGNHYTSVRWVLQVR